MERFASTFDHHDFGNDKPLFNFQKDVGETIGDAIDVGIEATQEAANIGLEAVQAAPKILEEKVEFAQGLGKTVAESSGVVKEVILEILD